MTDIVPAQVRAARSLIEWTQERLASAADVGLSTLRDFEAGRRQPYQTNLIAICATLEAARIVFVRETKSGGIGVRLKAGAGD